MTTTTQAGIVKLGPNKYEIRVRATCPRTGRRKEVERVRDCTLTEAKALQHEWREHMLAALTTERVTRQRLKDFVASWLRGRIESGELKASSADKIAVVWDLHIAGDDIAHLFTDDIGEADVKGWIERLRAKRYVPGKGKAAARVTRSIASEPRAYSRSTVRGYWRVLRTILVAAGAESACRVGKLKGSRSRPNYLRPDELGAVLAHIQANAAEWYPAVLLDAFAGLRWGELSALQWSDVDEANGVIRVERGNYKGAVVDSTKTGDDEDPEAKLVPLLPAVAEVLRERRQAMVASQHPGLASGWIFPTRRGTLHRGSPLRDVLDAACAAVGLGRRVTPHGLRHTANDLLRRVADGDTVRAIIGHVTPAMTHHYSHVDEADKHAAITRAFEVVRGTKGVIGGGTSLVVATTARDPKSENPAVTPGSLRGATQI